MKNPNCIYELARKNFFHADLFNIKALSENLYEPLSVTFKVICIIIVPQSGRKQQLEEVELKLEDLLCSLQ
jgi:hypothetical protein